MDNNFVPKSTNKIIKKDKKMGTIKASILKILANILGNYEFEIKSGLAKGLKRRVGKGFKPRWGLAEDEKFIKKLNFKGKTVFDIGGYIGMYSLFFGKVVGKKGKVFTFEPNPENYEELTFNVKLNKLKNIKTYLLAIGSKKTKLELTVPNYSSRGSLEPLIKKQICKEGCCNTFKVAVETIDSLIKRKLLTKPDFIKIDVEGFETEVLKGMIKTMKRFKPELFIEIHGKLKKETVKIILERDYSIYHVESDTTITSLNYPLIEEGHIYCK